MSTKEQPIQSLELLILLYATLAKTFLQAVDAFNNRDWKKLESLLDDNVILNRIDDPSGADSIIGKAEVSKYLENEVAKDKPKFTPKDGWTPDGRTGTVKGVAVWLDHDTDQNGNVVTTKRDITFSFIFTLHKPTGWLIVNLYGSPE